MDAQVADIRFLPALADQLAIWFPQLGGRALAVSDATITKENVPTLPLVMLAFIRSTASPPVSRVDMFEIVDTFVIDFWLEPARYKRTNSTETPFWSYYDYESIRDTLLTNLSRWEAPGGERITFRGLTIEAEPLAVTLTFTFNATFRWCPSKRTDYGEQFTIGFNLCTPSACIPDPCFDDEKVDECDPCP
jgi:hypothetical protein